MNLQSHSLAFQDSELGISKIFQNHFCSAWTEEHSLEFNNQKNIAINITNINDDNDNNCKL